MVQRLNSVFNIPSIKLIKYKILDRVLRGFIKHQKSSGHRSTMFGCDPHAKMAGPPGTFICICAVT